MFYTDLVYKKLCQHNGGRCFLWGREGEEKRWESANGQVESRQGAVIPHVGPTMTITCCTGAALLYQ